MEKKTEDQSDLIFSLDIGTRTLIGVVGEYTEDDEFLVHDYAIVEHKKRNMHDGQIHDVEGVARSVREVVSQLEASTGIKLHTVSIAAAGRALRTAKVRVEKVLDSRSEITRSHVDALELEGVQKAQREIDENIKDGVRYYNVGFTVMSYFLDEAPMDVLIGHRGERIGAEMIITFLPQVVIESLYSVIARVGLEVGSITLEPIAAMNVAIQEDLRLLNLALVDIGAGTSDIAITKEGRIISYGMTQTAGDEITEELARAFLLDFKTAEALKLELCRKEDHEFKSILGSVNHLTTEEIMEKINPVIERIADEVADRILEFNEKAPSAVFLVGGSSQIPNIGKFIASRLEIPEERVVIRDIHGIDNIEGLREDSGPDLITPIGIAIEGAQDKYKNYIVVHFEDREVRVFNTEEITVSDVLLLVGFDASRLMPKKSDDFSWLLNGKRRYLPYEGSTVPRILVDDEEGNIRTPLYNGARIHIEEPDPALNGARLYDLIQKERSVRFNGEEIPMVFDIYVNGKAVHEDVLIQPMDEVVTHEIQYLKELLDYVGASQPYYKYRLNTEPIVNNVRLSDGDIIERDDSLPPPAQGALDEKDDKVEEVPEEKKIVLIVNGEGQEFRYSGEVFQFIDLFDYLDFDTSRVQGELVLEINGEKAEYGQPLKDGDKITVMWK